VFITTKCQRNMDIILVAGMHAARTGTPMPQVESLS
jgi:hypothetical protein